MSTRKATNKTSATESATGSESEPLTPTSRDSNNSTPAPETKRKRRTNSTQSVSTPKREPAEPAAIDKKGPIKDKDTIVDEKLNSSITDSPSKARNRRVIDKTTKIPLRSKGNSPKTPTRTSTRAKTQTAKATPRGTQKPRAKKKSTTATDTPVKSEDSNQTETDSEQVPPMKRIKLEKSDDEPKEEIVMEIRTQILGDRIPSKINIIDSISLDSVLNKEDSKIKVEPKMYKVEELNKSDQKDGAESEEIKKKSTKVPDDKDKAETKVKRPYRRKLNTTQDKKNSNSPEMSGVRRGSRIRKTLSPSGKVISPKRKYTKAVKAEPKSSTSPEPESSEQTTSKGTESVIVEKDSKPSEQDSRDSELSEKIDEETKPVEQTSKESENIEDEIENAELIFITTTDPNNQQEQLTVDITTPVPDDKEESSVPSTNSTRGSEKSASLSPNDLESEGVCEMSMKQFYKEPEFLENNRGIEEDPKLGGIVQTVEKESGGEDDSSTTLIEDSSAVEVSQTVTDASDSLQEGALLVLDDSTEDEATKSGNLSGSSVLEVSSESDNKSETLKTSEAIESNAKMETDMIEKTKEECSEIEEVKGEVVEVKDEVVEKVAQKIIEKPENTEDADVEMVACDEPKRSNSTEAESKVDEPKKSDEKSSEEKTEQIALNEMDTIEEEDTEKALESKDCIVMEIDSGVSDVAENNSNDPNEDLTLLQEIIDGEQKTIVSDNENAVMPSDLIVSVEKDKSLDKDSEVEESVVKSDVNDEKVVEKEQVPVAKEDSAIVADVSEDNIEVKDAKIEMKDSKVEVVEAELKDTNKDDAVVVDEKEEMAVVKDATESESKLDISIKEEKSDEEPKLEPIIAPATESIVRKTPETPETLKQKEHHFKSLGLLTLKAADEAKIEKQKRREQLNANKKLNGNSFVEENDGASSSRDDASADNDENNINTCRDVQEYTGTLKTVIKLNRPTIGQGNRPTIGQGNNNSEKKKSYSNGNGTSTAGAAATASTSSSSNRVPLKMTFQKGRGRNGHSERHANGSQGTNDDYYTIQNEGETGTPTETVTTHDPNSTETAGTEKKETKETIVIPEKASSFAIHPGRLCQDQCFYCGGKFGLYDTPCHVAQIKSLERQKRILDNEEKLTVDNCLCDACFRHIDRRANQAKKRQEANANQEMTNIATSTDSNERSATESIAADTMPIPAGHSLLKSICFVTNCGQPATHTFRRKGFRKTIRKLLGDGMDTANLGGRLPICDKHYEVIIQCLECALCKRRLIKNHMHHVTQDVQQLQDLLQKQGLPVKLAINPAVCKLCRYFMNLLLKPPEGKTQKAEFVKNYRRKLLHFHNIQQSDEASETEEQDDQDKSKQQATIQPAKRGRKPKSLTIVSVEGGVTVENNNSPPSVDDGSSNDIVDLDADDDDTPPSSEVTKSGQMQLDNDVMVDYDMPMICDSPSPPATVSAPPSKLQAILQRGSTTKKTNEDISIALRSNPNISMRELFPGEEEMGLQVNVPFGSSSSQRTPEGWTRVQTFLQYDEPTRRLWEELQKPYGNQSSFLRHLILLEKYFRNGDLILSQNATTNSVIYSESVQNRLSSYDNRSPSNPATDSNPTASTSSKKNRSSGSFTSGISNGSIKPVATATTATVASETNQIKMIPATTIFKPKIQPKLSIPSNLSRHSDPIKKLHNNLTITITPKTKFIPETIVSNATPASSNTTPSPMPTTSSGESILKSNLLGRKNSAIEIIPIGSGPNELNGNNCRTTVAMPVQQQSLLTKQQKILAAASQLMSDDKTSTTTTTTTTNNSAINYGPMRSNVGSNLPPELICINRGRGANMLLLSNPSTSSNFPGSKHRMPPVQHPQHHAARPLKMPPTIVKLPETLSYHERVASKNWRPTLMPINSGPVRSAPGVLYQTADGRKLPSLVQVQSAGKPYLISIHDYNRMCLLRREKIMREQLMKSGNRASTSSSAPNNTR